MIGIFDSGVGGMTVAHAVEQLLPDYSLVYYGDIARSPYGPKSPKTIIDYSIHNTEFLLDKGAELIIIACNSASSVATETLREKFSVPIIEVITPAANRAISSSQNGRIGVIGTRATVRSDIYQKTILARQPDCKVFQEICPLLVPLVEEGWLNKRETKMILRRYLAPFKNRQIDTLVLGCTHYPLLKNLIQPRIGKRVKLIDSSIETAHYVKEFLLSNPNIISKNGNASHRYYVSDSTETARPVAERIFSRPMELIIA
ncbi:glutamate racemase [Desulfocapsa sulfexigens DSM 10523]|uniref:Glutamate racemase n=1 Tax=Desulfocapsa sulfexigens (strain DSM 10523 / SB164P1) TaxID=1167006 RepID=M1NGA3_DESSD|nr:glutamate racemase [Desulfocapsa sulfexigens]AGF78684.1 glutamate racemase [Desulfocapsa sulfexigens DSM 10523]